MSELRECPFCGCDNFSLVDMTYMQESGPTKGKRVKCQQCGAQAPDTVWNTRTLPPGKVLCDAEPVVWMSQVLSDDERNLFDPVLHLDKPKTKSGPLLGTGCRLVITPLYAAAKGEM